MVRLMSASSGTIFLDPTEVSQVQGFARLLWGISYVSWFIHNLVLQDITSRRFSATNRTTYRPTNEDCLMRDVVTPNFCKVCIEELWLRLLRRISIIENGESGCRSFSISLLPLAQFRTNETLVGTEESYEIVWSRKREGNSSSSQFVGVMKLSQVKRTGSSKIPREVPSLC